MHRRQFVRLTGAWLVGLAGAAALGGCQRDEGSAGGGSSSAGGSAQGPAGKPDIKQLASGLQTKTVAMIDAINAKNQASMDRAKGDLSKEADKVEDALKSETGQAANRVNAAVNRIRNGLLGNDVKLLEQARDLLQQAQTQA
jgi:hypothetical protein